MHYSTHNSIITNSLQGLNSLDDEEGEELGMYKYKVDGDAIQQFDLVSEMQRTLIQLYACVYISPCTECTNMHSSFR